LLLERAIEGFLVELELALKIVRRDELVVERAEDALQVARGRVVALEEELLSFAVGEAVEQNRARLVAVAAGAANLLIEGLDGAGECDVNDGTDVGFIDTHAEGDGSDDDLELAGLEVALHAVACSGVEAGVIRGTTELRVQARGELLGGLARGRVDDGGARGGVGEKLLGELRALGF
jgi:hypothetical protein